MATSHDAAPTAKQFIPVAAACLLVLILAIAFINVGVDKVRGIPSATAANSPARATEPAAPPRRGHRSPGAFATAASDR